MFDYLNTILFSVQASGFQGDCYLPAETIIKYRVYSNSHSLLHSHFPSSFLNNRALFWFFCVLQALYKRVQFEIYVANLENAKKKYTGMPSTQHRWCARLW